MADLQQPIEIKLLKIVADYRNTPIEGSKTPTERIFAYKLKTWFDTLKPKKKLSTKNTSILKVRTFGIGDRVQSRNYFNSGKWQYGVIVNHIGKLHYLAKLDNEMR